LGVFSARAKVVTITFKKVREVRVFLIFFIFACLALFMCLICLGVAVIAWIMDECVVVCKCLTIARENSGGYLFSRPSERVSLRRD